MGNFDKNTPITEPSLEDCGKLIGILSRGYYARAATTHEPLPCFSNFHLNGVVGVIFSDESAAATMAEDAASAYEIDAEVSRVTGLWEFFAECAACGYEGVVLDNYYPVTFFNRLTDMDRRSPTLMWMRFPDSTTELSGFFFGRVGVVRTEPGTTVKWLDYEKFDKASNRYVLHGNPLPEPIDAHVITADSDDLYTFPDGASFLGPYVSDMGAIPVFSGRAWAEYFAWAHGIVEEPEDKHGLVSLSNGLVLKNVRLLEFLESVAARDWPFVDIGLNPLCHRFRQGWFFREGKTWFLETISGVWELSRQGLVHRDDVRPYKSYLGQSADPALLTVGVATVTERPFKRLMGADRALLPEDDASALLEAELATSFEPLLIEGNSSIPVDAFVIDAFDKVTGEIFALSTYDHASHDLGFLVFPDAIAAVRYLVHEVLPHDEQIRISGYRLCHGGGSQGSKDPKLELRITSSIVAALRKTLLDALTKGFRPEHGLHIRRLMQDATVTFEVTEIGYFGDLLFYGTADGRSIEDRIHTDEPEGSDEQQAAERQRKKLNVARKKIVDQVALSPVLVSQLRKRLGRAYDFLTDESRVIAATVIEQFNRVGMRPGYDYAGISMKASKLIERELTIRVFRPWRTAVREKLGKYRLARLREEVDAPLFDRTDDALVQWLQKKGQMDLGTMRFCLRVTRGGEASTTPRKLLADYLAELPDGHWLTSEEFESALLDISTKYRNGGVHEHVVTFEICREAVNRILLDPNPLLQQLMEATASVNVN